MFDSKVPPRRLNGFFSIEMFDSKAFLSKYPTAKSKCSTAKRRFIEMFDSRIEMFDSKIEMFDSSSGIIIQNVPGFDQFCGGSVGNF